MFALHPHVFSAALSPERVLAAECLLACGAGLKAPLHFGGAGASCPCPPEAMNCPPEAMNRPPEAMNYPPEATDGAYSRVSG